MKRITLQEAEEFLPLKLNYTDTSVAMASYYTISPSSRGNGFEDVTYYTSIKKKLLIDKNYV